MIKEINDFYLWGEDIGKSKNKNELKDLFYFFESQNKKNIQHLKCAIEGYIDAV